MIRRSPLHELHLASGARLADFAGWEMPLRYESALKEHAAVRDRAGLFDVSHLGNVFVAGTGAEGFLESFFPGRVAQLAEGSAGYNIALTATGGIADDLFVYRRSDDFMLVPNAANTPEIASRLAGSAPPGVTVSDQSQQWAILAFSGPLAARAMQESFPEAARLKLHRFAAAGPAHQWMVARTGYTGEPTFEFFVPAAEAADTWEQLMNIGRRVEASPAGLAARDLLRLEMGYPLHGSDIGPDTNPLEAGLEWLIDWNKDFPGKKPLAKIAKRGVARRLTGLISRGEGIPRAGCGVYDGGEEAGTVTSGNFSPVLQKGIALAYLLPHLAAAGTPLTVDVRGRRLEVEVTKPPFIPR